MQKVVTTASFVVSGELYNLGADELNKLLDEGWEIKTHENVSASTGNGASIILFILTK